MVYSGRADAFYPSRLKALLWTLALALAAALLGTLSAGLWPTALAELARGTGPPWILVFPILFSICAVAFAFGAAFFLYLLFSRRPLLTLDADGLAYRLGPFGTRRGAARWRDIHELSARIQKASHGRDQLVVVFVVDHAALAAGEHPAHLLMIEQAWLAVPASQVAAQIRDCYAAATADY